MGAITDEGFHAQKRYAWTTNYAHCVPAAGKLDGFCVFVWPERHTYRAAKHLRQSTPWGKTPASVTHLYAHTLMSVTGSAQQGTAG